ncbi:MAG TPA: sigma-70 family RNA polymerase sigma factor [Acidimicrobiia bacterium]|nr:sigma-70 family RNA polymerase sigma factor [Acidimicrobiia bacterium]
MKPELAETTGQEPVARQLERYRRELIGFCYRMLGSSLEAEDAVQETLTRAWRAYDRFEGRSGLRTWLYRIATNVCIDMLKASQRRALPMDLSEAGKADDPLAPPLPERSWVEPIPDQLVLDSTMDPADLAVARESIRLAFIAALQHLPARQRAVLILRDVLQWQASEVADLLGSSVASVNSALQRARATLDARRPVDVSDSEVDSDLLARYLDAFQRYDMAALTELITADAIQSMPPYSHWLRGREEILSWWVGPGAGCRGSLLIPTEANGVPAFGQYRPSGPGGAFEPWSLHVLNIKEGRIVEFTFFLDTARFFPLFGLPTSREDIDRLALTTA